MQIRTLNLLFGIPIPKTPQAIEHHEKDSWCWAACTQDGRAKAVCLALLFFLLSGSGKAATAGDWSGTLNFPQQQLRFILHITGSGGALHATADSPDQGGYGYPVDSINVSGQTLSFQMNALGVTFRGQINGNQIAGSFSQHGMNVPLTLTQSGSNS